MNVVLTQNCEGLLSLLEGMVSYHGTVCSVCTCVQCVCVCGCMCTLCVGVDARVHCVWVHV